MLLIIPILMSMLEGEVPSAKDQPQVEVEEAVSTFVSPNNGSGPLWCYGAPLVVRIGQTVFVNATETGAGVPPLCNTRWRIFRRASAGQWEIAWQPQGYREREPCPIVAFQDGSVFVSMNPSLTPPGTHYQACDPHLLEFASASPESPGRPLRPPWPKGTTFTDHSYRGIAADGARGEILLLNIDAKTSQQHWAFYDSKGYGSRTGAVSFPVRSCYPQAALKNRSAHILAIGDIVEPVEEWRRFKKEKTGSEWDYVFRRLFYTWTPDIASRDFSAPLEIDSVDQTGGHIINLDLWVDAKGNAHILYLKQKTSPVLREKYFPDIPLRSSLEYCVVQNGKVIRRTTLVEGGEGLAGEVPRYARFHTLGPGRLLVIYSCTLTRPGTETVWENRWRPLLPRKGKTGVLALQYPFTTFFTAAERGGSAPSKVLDLFGTGVDSSTLRYARIRFR